MKSVVCNAGPLIALSGIGQTGLLRELFGEVLVSEKVRDEVEAGGLRGGGSQHLRERTLDPCDLTRRPSRPFA